MVIGVNKYAVDGNAVVPVLVVDPELEENVLRTNATVAVREFLEALGFAKPLPGA